MLFVELFRIEQLRQLTLIYCCRYYMLLSCLHLQTIVVSCCFEPSTLVGL